MSNSVSEIGIDQLATAAQSGATVIDVREPKEYATGHVAGAKSVPMGQLPSRVDELDRAQPVYVICASGNRSAAMAAFLVQAGFQAWSVAGGTQAWAAAGHPLTTGPSARS